MNNNIRLNQKQDEAVKDSSPVVRVIAGAGTGKTTLIIARINYLIEQLSVKPNEIVAITFTNYAARNIKNRITVNNQKFYNDENSVQVFTYHGFCLNIIKQLKAANYVREDFQLINNKKKIITNIINDHFRIYKKDLNANELIFFFLKLKLLDFHYSLTETLEKLDKALEAGSFYNSHLQETITENSRYWIYYLVFYKLIEYQKLNKYWDFDDLLIYTNIVLANKQNLEYIHGLYKHILLDEFQDTNYIQYEIVKKVFNKNDGHLFLVGDPDQSIYKWRDAEPEILVDKLVKDYPEVIKTHVIDINYRSDNNILRASNSLILLNYSENDEIFKKLKSDQPLGKKVEIYNCHDSYHVCNLVVNEVKKIMTKNHAEIDEVAILYRANHTSLRLEVELNRQNIPFEIYRNLQFLDLAFVKKILSLFNILYFDDTLALQNVINLNSKGIGKVFLNNIQKNADLTKRTFFQEVFQENPTPILLKNKKLLTFIQITKKYRKLANQYLVSPATTLCNYLKEIEFDAYTQKLDVTTKFKNYHSQLFQKFISMLQDHFKNNSYDSAKDYLIKLSIKGKNEKEEGPKVKLMTMHAAKGLEFKHVFILVFGSRFSATKNYSFDSDQIEEENSEERCLFYVALTRAKKSLKILSCDADNVFVNNLVDFDSEGYSKYIDLQRPHLNRNSGDDSNEEVVFLKQDAAEPISAKEVSVGTEIMHPFFEKGTVLSIIKKDGYTLCEVAFKKARQLINLQYVLSTCQLVGSSDDN